MALSHRGLARLVETLPGGASFTGAYDGVETDLAHAYGMRRLLTSYTGNLIRLRRDSDNAESDFGADANGHLDTAAIASWLGGAGGWVVTWYDQTGNDDTTQSTVTTQPQYVASSQNGHPGISFSGSGRYFQATATASLGTSASFIVVAQLDATAVNDGSARRIIDTAGGPAGQAIFGQYQTPDPDVFAIFNTTFVEGSASTSDWLVWAVVIDGASATLHLNGSLDASGNAGNRDVGSGLNIGGRTISSNWKGYINEFLAFNDALTSGERGTAQTAAADYWGITLA